MGCWGDLSLGGSREVLSGSRWTGPHRVAQVLGTVRVHRGPISQKHAHGRGMEKSFPDSSLMWSYCSRPLPRTASQCGLWAGRSGSWHRKGRSELSWPVCWARGPAEESGW